MVRNFFSDLQQKRYFLMFFTAIIYIVGLCAFFSGKTIEIAAIVTIFLTVALLKNYLSAKTILFWYLIFFIAYFNASLRIHNSDDLLKIAPKKATVVGQVVSIPDSGIEGKTRFFLDVKSVEYDGKVQNISGKTFVSVFYDKEKPEFNIGNTYCLSGKLKTPFRVSNPSQFDYGAYLKNYNAFTVFYASSADSHQVVTELSPKWKFLQGLNNVRNNIIKTNSKYLKSPNLEILGGIVFGDDAVSPPDYIKNIFINSGLLHILAASGMNVALISGILYYVLKLFKVPFRVSIVSSIVAIILYTLMTGMGPSVVRATIILIFVLLGKLIDRDAHSVSLLSFVALLMLLYNPAYINDVGFQLSFVVTFGLLVMTEPVLKYFKFMPEWLSGAIFIPIIAQIWVAPIQIYYFNTFSLYSIFANILSVPILTVLSFGGFISTVLALIKPIADFVCMGFDFILNPFLNALVYISTFFASLPHSLVHVQKLTLLQIFFYYEAVMLLILLLRGGFLKKYFISLLAVITVTIGLGVQYPKFELIAFDMQNADAFLLNVYGKYYIIDTGKSGYNGVKSPAKFIIVEYLKDIGVKDIEGLILTHFDADHAGGAQDLLEELRIKRVYVNSLKDKSKIAQNLYRRYPQKLIVPKNNEVIFTDNDKDITIKILKANLPEINKYENENSLITLISKGDFDILMMGDAGIKAFSCIEQNLPNIEVLKVGHHGAKNVVSKRMLDKINPQYAIISTGLNRYGHPNPVTLKLLEAHNVNVLRTDKNNAIRVGDSKIETFTKDAGWLAVSEY